MNSTGQPRSPLLRWAQHSFPCGSGSCRSGLGSAWRWQAEPIGVGSPPSRLCWDSQLPCAAFGILAGLDTGLTSQLSSTQCANDPGSDIPTIFHVTKEGEFTDANVSNRPGPHPLPGDTGGLRVVGGTSCHAGLDGGCVARLLAGVLRWDCASR